MTEHGDQGHVEPGGPALVRTALAADGLVEIRKFSVGPMDNNVYLLTDLATRRALLIDAADEPDRILVEIGDRSVEAIITTHGHQDHWQGLAAVADATDATVWLHPDDAARIPRVADRHCEDGAVVRAGAVEVRLVHTPGHTPGSTCLVLDGPAEDGSVGRWLFSGDTLFPGGPGNTFGDPEAFRTIMGSLRERVFALPDDTQVCPGHGDDTAIGAERPHLDEWQARGW